MRDVANMEIRNIYWWPANENEELKWYQRMNEMTSHYEIYIIHYDLLETHADTTQMNWPILNRHDDVLELTIK